MCCPDESLYTYMYIYKLYISFIYMYMYKVFGENDVQDENSSL